jgi:hypothetical protein
MVSIIEPRPHGSITRPQCTQFYVLFLEGNFRTVSVSIFEFIAIVSEAITQICLMFINDNKKIVCRLSSVICNLLFRDSVVGTLMNVSGSYM